MINMTYAIVGAVFMGGMALFAFLKGDDPERFGAGAYFFAWLASVVIQQDQGLQDLPIAIFLIDLAVLAVFVGLTWKARKSWPVWASALQLIIVMSHFMILINAGLPKGPLYTILNLGGYLIIGCIIVGTFWAWQERRAAGLE